MHLRACKISKSPGGGPPDPPSRRGKYPPPPHTEAGALMLWLKIFLLLLFYKLKTLDMTLCGRTMLAKSLGFSQLIYATSMRSVPEIMIQKTQSKPFAFIWKNKRDKIKRQVLLHPLSKGGPSFPCFRTLIKASCLSWISRLFNNTHDTWTAIPNYYFNKHGRLFLLNCKLQYRETRQKNRLLLSRTS